MIDLTALMSAGIWFMLVAPPGCAKTARIRQASIAAGRKLFLGIDGRTCDLMDRLDAAGAIYPDKSTGMSELFPLRALREILDCTEPAVWFLDEIGRAPIDVQGALCSLMDLIKRTKPNIMVCAATNRPQDKAGVSALSSQIESRFAVTFGISVPGSEDRADGGVMLGQWCHAGIDCDGCEVCGWTDYAMAQCWPAEVIAWHRNTSGRTLYAWQNHKDPSVRYPDYRAWETVCKLWQAGFRDLNYIAGAVGKPTAAEFLAYARLAADLPDPTEVWLDPDGATVPQDPSALFLITTMLASAAHADVAGAMVKYMKRLPRVYAALLGRDAYKRLKVKLSSTPEWQEWFRANQDLFKGQKMNG